MSPASCRLTNCSGTRCPPGTELETPRGGRLRVNRREYLGHSTGLLLPGQHHRGAAGRNPAWATAPGPPRRGPSTPPARGSGAATHCSLVPSTEGLNGSSPRRGPGPAGRPGRSPATAMPGPRGPEALRHHRAQLGEGPRPPLWRVEDSCSLPVGGRERGSVRPGGSSPSKKSKCFIVLFLRNGKAPNDQIFIVAIHTDHLKSAESF